MQDLKITLVQASQIWEDKDANLMHYDALLGSVTLTDLVLLPEMFHTGFTMNGQELAENMEGKAMQWLQATSARIRSAIYTSFICRENGQLFNRGIFMQPDGTYHTYDKRKTFGLAGEPDVYASGTRECILSWKGWNINLQICYDLRFPENIRNGIENGAAAYDVLLYVANWPERRSEHWNTLLKARAIENQCYVAGVNRTGSDANGLTYSGNSAVYGALGEQLVYSTTEESVITTVLSASRLLETRTRLPFLIDSVYRSFNR